MQLYKTDPLSKRVCEKCVSNLQIISSLKKLSRKTQEKYVEKLKNQGDTTDKNVLLFLGCTGSKVSFTKMFTLILYYNDNLD